MSPLELARAFAFDGLPVAALVLELDGTIVAANAAARRAFPGELVGGRVRALAAALDRAWPGIVEDLTPSPPGVPERPSRRTEDGSVVETVRVTRGSDERSYEIVFALVDAGRPVVQALAIDVTQHATRARGEADERLASKLRLESLGLVAGGIAHDFNNLLVGVLAEASAAREDPKLAEPTLEALRRIEAAARRMAQLTRQLLAYAGRGQVQTAHLTADELVGDLRDQLERLVRTGVALEISPSAGAAVVEADAHLMKQVVLNLVANASDANSRRVQVTTRIVSRDGTPWWQLEVADDGDGIDAHTLVRIFEPFFSTKPNHHGLGLSAVHGIVRRLGGDVEVDAKPGLGARFRVQLPVVAGAAPKRRAATEQSGPVAQHRLTGLRVLVVDDEPSVRATVRRLLERRGATVVVANDGLEADARMRDERFDLVISDVSMPGLGGYEVLAIARTLMRGVPVILMSGYTERARGEGSEDVPDAFLEKPFTAKVLDAAIDQVLR